MHAREGRFEQALADYDRTAELTPSWIDAFTGRGRIHTSMGHYDRALADFQRAIEIGGAGGELRWELAQALDRLGRYEEAVRVLEDHAAANPGQEWVFRSIAYILFSHGRLDESLAALDRAVDAQPANPAHYAARGLISLFRPDLCERARSDLDRALELAPHSARVWALVAQGHVEGASRHCPGVYDPDRALELARRAVEQDSQSMFFQYVLGLAFYRHGLYEESRSALLRALELETDPGDEPFASFALAMVCAKLDRRAEARDHYDHGVARMRELHPESPRLTLLRGEAVELLGIRP
jgi:tetratricopeptide (TPR) repeat protein